MNKMIMIIALALLISWSTGTLRQDTNTETIDPTPEVFVSQSALSEYEGFIEELEKESSAIREVLDDGDFLKKEYLQWAIDAWNILLNTDKEAFIEALNEWFERADDLYELGFKYSGDLFRDLGPDWVKLGEDVAEFNWEIFKEEKEGLLSYIENSSQIDNHELASRIQELILTMETIADIETAASR